MMTVEIVKVKKIDQQRTKIIVIEYGTTCSPVLFFYACFFVRWSS